MLNGVRSSDSAAMRQIHEEYSEMELKNIEEKDWARSLVFLAASIVWSHSFEIVA